MNAIATSTPADRHNPITAQGDALHHGARHDTNHAAIHQGISNVALVKPHRAIDGGNTHAISVVAYPGNYLRQNAPRRKAPSWNIGALKRRNAEDIGRRNGLGAEACPHDVTNATANTGSSAAVRFNGAGAIVRLTLEAHCVVVIKGNDPRVVYKYGKAPIDTVRVVLINQFKRSGGDGALQEVRDSHRSIMGRCVPWTQCGGRIRCAGMCGGRKRVQQTLARLQGVLPGSQVRFAIVDRALQRLMYAVFAPSLRQCFQFDLARLPTEAAIFRLDRLHFLQ